MRKAPGLAETRQSGSRSLRQILRPLGIEWKVSQMTDMAAPPPLQDHLPTALDAMEKDGWSLMAIFGETKSEKVGFVFRRISE